MATPVGNLEMEALVIFCHETVGKIGPSVTRMAVGGPLQAVELGFRSEGRATIGEVGSRPKQKHMCSLWGKACRPQ